MLGFVLYALTIRIPTYNPQPIVVTSGPISSILIIVPSWITDIIQLTLRSSMNEVRHTTNDGEREPKLYIRSLFDTTKVSESVKGIIKFERVDGIIVLLDALGIKGIWKRKDPAKVLEGWSSLQKEYINGFKSLRDRLRAYGDLKETRFEAFSDTMMVSLPVKKRDVGIDIGRNSAWWTIMLIGELLIQLFRVSISHNFLFRGCVSAGIFFRSENMTIGPAVDEALNIIHSQMEWHFYVF